MQELVILSRLEQEYLLRAIEGGLYVQMLRQLFTWCQGGISGLLPHCTMVCIQLDDADQVLHVECLNSLPRDAEEIKLLCERQDGLAIRLVRHCREFGKLSCRIDSADPEIGVSQPAAGTMPGGASRSLAKLAQDVQRLRLGNALVHGTERLHGGSTFFALFEMSVPPSVRHEFFLSLLLPHLHLAFLRVIANRDQTFTAITPTLALSARELEVLSYVLAGKTNVEIGMILGLSALTVKNHLQKIYRKLNVSNRVQALARSHELKLFAPKHAFAATAPGAALRRLTSQ